MDKTGKTPAPRKDQETDQPKITEAHRVKEYVNLFDLSRKFLGFSITGIETDKPIDGKPRGKRADIFLKLSDGYYVIFEVKNNVLISDDVTLVQAFAQALLYRTKFCRSKKVSKAKVFMGLILPSVTVDFLDSLKELQTAFVLPIIIMTYGNPTLLEKHTIMYNEPRN